MAQFAQTHPGSTLTINDVPQNQTDQKLQLEGAQNALPDMFFGPGTPAAQKQMCDQGLSLNVGDAADKLGVTAAFNPAAVKVIENQQGGKLCAIPFELNMEGFWYNTKIFSANGLTPPATWDALVSDAAALSGKGIQPFAASGLQGWPLTRLVSGYIFRDQGPDAMQKIADGTAKLTDPEYVKAAAAVAALGSKNYFGKGVASLDYSPAEAEFLTGKAAMFYMGSWVLSDFNTASLNQIGDSNIGFFPFPAVAGGSGSIDQTPENAGQPVMISAKSYNANPAMADWLKFVLQNYGSAAIALGDLSGFAIAQTPATLPNTTKLAIAELAATQTPVGWFETLFNAKATNVSQTNAARLVTGSLSPQNFMATVQAAVPGS